MPPQFQQYTITLPDGSAFNCWIENLYEPERDMNWLIQLADCEAYSTYDDPPRAELTRVAQEREN